ncbi:MAG TPA: radical SAM protein [Methanospirillum sp.]|nr:radical SAM protein [Methanospirillum sp.]
MKIDEIFTSIQGEGLTAGYPTVFVRCAGCNLRCTYCDTLQAQEVESGRDIAVASVAEEVFRSGSDHVCITGGEPLMQREGVFSLLQMLHDSGRDVSIETNGTIDFRILQPYASICMDVKCPSSGEKSDISLLSCIRPSDSVKFVIGTDEDIAYAHQILIDNQVSGTVFWSPVFGSDQHRLIGYIIDNKLKVRFQLQLHKVVGVR